MFAFSQYAKTLNKTQRKRQVISDISDLICFVQNVSIQWSTAEAKSSFSPQSSIVLILAPDFSNYPIFQIYFRFPYRSENSTFCIMKIDCSGGRIVSPFTLNANSLQNFARLCWEIILIYQKPLRILFLASCFINKVRCLLLIQSIN